MKKQPILTGFPRTVLATARRRLQAAIRHSRRLLIDRCLNGYALLFEPILPAAFLASIDATRRQRFFGHIPVFWAWIAQILEANSSCSKALGLIQSWHQANGLPAPKGDTSGYCQGRIRLKEEFLAKIAKRITQSMRPAIQAADLWHGMVLKAIDGSSVRLMDTPENQAAYPQPVGQKPGCGFPVMGIVGLLNLSHGGWEAVETCPASKHDSRMAPLLLPHIERDDLLLADRAFCSFEFIASLLGRGAHVLMRLHQARHAKLDWRRGKRLSPIERLVTWNKPPAQPKASDLPPEQWAALPDRITLRYIRMGYEDRAGRKRQLVVVTDLLDSRIHDPLELSCLYARRWEIELRLRDVKTTLGMELFAVKTPAMAHKTLRMMLIAYNLTRAIMQQAAHTTDSPACAMSFKATLDLLTSSHESFRMLAGKPRALRHRRQQLIALCATKMLDPRPLRREPRALKRRHKNYQLLNRPRHLFEECPHRERYRKSA